MGYLAMFVVDIDIKSLGFSRFRMSHDDCQLVKSFLQSSR